MSFDKRHPPEGNVHYLWTEGEFYDACDRIDEDRGGTTPIAGRVVSIHEAPGTQPDQSTFEEIEERNRRNKERLEKERGQANKAVLRSYRIRHD